MSTTSMKWFRRYALSGMAILALTASQAFAFTDTDTDGIDDDWETQYFGDLTTADATTDYDKDGLTDKEEYLSAYALDPKNADTDNDGLTDYEEIKTYKTDPTSEDSDGDGISDFDEVNYYSTNPNSADTDLDDYSDSEEIFVMNTDPLSAYSPYENRALKLNGTSGYLYKDDFAEIADLKEYTLAAWFNLDETSGKNGSIIQHIDKTTGNYDFRLFLNNGKLNFSLVVAGKGLVTYEFPEAEFAYGDGWTHVAVAVEQTRLSPYQYNVKMYVNRGGEELDAFESGSQSGLIKTVAKKPSLVVGDLDSAAERLAMRFDEFVIWNEAKTQEDIQAVRNGTLIDTTNVAVYFEFNDGGHVNAIATMYKALADAQTEYNRAQAEYSSAYDAYYTFLDSQLSDSKKTYAEVIADIMSKEDTDDTKKKYLALDAYLTSAYSRYKTADAELAALTGKDYVAKIKSTADKVQVDAAIRSDETYDYLFADNDGDKLPDFWEIYYFGSTDVTDGTQDYDGDKLNDKYEYLAYGDPTDQYSLDPAKVKNDGAFDSDGDGLLNAEEADNNTNPLNPDTDDDGVNDKVEIAFDASPNHPASVVIERATGKVVTATYADVIAQYGSEDQAAQALRSGINNYASLDLGAIAADVELPGASRFAVEDGDFTLEFWVKDDNGSRSGKEWIFDYQGIDSTYGFRFGLQDGAPYGEIYSVKFGTIYSHVGGSTGECATPALEKGVWTHVALNWQRANRVLGLYRDGVAFMGSVPVAYNVSFAAGNDAASINKLADVSIDEFRFWNSSRTASEIEYWKNKIVPSPLWSDALPTMNISGMQYENPLRVYYRFDDKGALIEDFARFMDEDYMLDIVSAVFTDGAKEINGVDDVDGDGIPEWWVNVWNLDNFNTYNLIPTDDEDDYYYWKKLLYWDGTTILGLGAYQSGCGYTGIGGKVRIVDMEDGGYKALNQVISPDMKYVQMFKYFTLTRKPDTAQLTILKDGNPEVGALATITAVIINGQSVTDFDRIADYLVCGRNQIVLNWERSIFSSTEYKWTIGESEVTYVRDNYQGTVDVSLIADNQDVIVLGNKHPYDPRSAWYYRAMSAYTACFSTNLLVGADKAGYTLTSPDILSSTPSTYGLNFAVRMDSDGDGLSVYDEYVLQTNPLAIDSNNNGVNDFDEDYDGDGLINGFEVMNALDPLSADTDNDGVKDGAEDDHTTAPQNWNDPGEERALLTDGSDDSYLLLPAQARYALSTWTLEAWVKPLVDNANGVIISRIVGTLDPANPLVNYQMSLVDGKLTSIFTDGAKTKSTVSVDSAKAIEKDLWNHVAVIFDGSNSTVYLYINGKLVKQKKAPIAPIAAGSGLILTKVGQGFNGYIDDLRIWSDVRTAAELTQYMDEEVPEDAENLIANFMFNDVNLKGRAEVAGTTEAEIAADPSKAPQYYLYAANTTSATQRDWLNDWTNAGILNGNATVVLADEAVFGIEVTSLSNVDEDHNGIADVAYIPADGSADGYDVLTAYVNAETSDDKSEEIVYSFFWMLNTTFASGDLVFKEGTLFDKAGNEIEAIIGYDKELDLASIEGLTDLDAIQLAVVAKRTSGKASVDVVAPIPVDESSAAVTVPGAPAFVSFTPESPVKAGQMLVVKLRNDNEAGTIVIQWFKNLVMVASSSANCASGETVTFTMDGNSIKHGDVWSFKAYFVKDGIKSRSVPSVAVDGTGWIFRQVGSSYNEQVSDKNTAPTVPTSVTVSPASATTISVITASAEGSHDPDGDKFGYYYQWYIKAAGTTSYVMATGQNQPYWQNVIVPVPANSSDDDDTTETSTGDEGEGTVTASDDDDTTGDDDDDDDDTSITNLDVGDMLYVKVYAMDIYGNRSAALTSKTIMVMDNNGTTSTTTGDDDDDDSGSSSYTSDDDDDVVDDTGWYVYEDNDNWLKAKPIYSKAGWMLSDSNVQTHYFYSRNDEDWVSFVLPANLNNNKLSVKFETNTGTMFTTQHRYSSDTGPDTMIELYKLNPDTGKLNAKPVFSNKDYAESTATLGQEGLGRTIYARFEMDLEPGTYYVRVLLQERLDKYVGQAYQMHFYYEEAPGVEGPYWDTLTSPVSLAPATAYDDDDLTVSIDTEAVSLVPGNKVTYSYVWYRNGQVVPFGGNVKIDPAQTVRYLLAHAKTKANSGSEPWIVPYELTNPGEYWYCAVYAKDSNGYSEPAYTNGVIIGGTSWQSWSAGFNATTAYMSGETTDVRLNIGWEANATFGYDSYYDVAAAPNVAPDGKLVFDYGTAYFIGLSNEQPMLLTDVRPSGVSSSWFAVVELGKNSMAASKDNVKEFRLSWDAMPLPIRNAQSLTVTQMRRGADGVMEATGETVKIEENTAGEIVISQSALSFAQTDSYGQKYLIFRISLGSPDTMQLLNLSKGWNMIALPVTPLNNSVSDVFSRNSKPVYSGNVYVYENGRYVAASQVVAARGYWLYCPQAVTDLAVYGSLETTSIPLSEGWNVVGPVYDIVNFKASYNKTAYPGILKAITGNDKGDGLEIYEFDTLTGGYLPAVNPVNPSDFIMETGKAYWIKSAKAVELPVIIPEL